jgi:competence protein ComEC
MQNSTTTCQTTSSTGACRNGSGVNFEGWPTWVITVPWQAGRLVGEAAIVTIAVQFVLVILMVESYHRISPISLPLNVLGALIATVITPLGLLLIGLPGFLGVGVAWVMKSLLGLLVFAVDVGLRLPGATFRVGSPPAWIWVFYALVIVGWTLAVRHRRLLATGLCFSAALCLQGVMILADFSPEPPPHATLTFLDVGQGDSTLIELTDGKRILVDGGGVSSGRYRALVEEGTFSIGEDVVSPYLFKRRIRRIDALILTHAHHDHLDGLFDVLENFEVGEVWLGRNPMVPEYRKFLEQIYRRQIPIRWVWAGQQIGPFTVLHPPADWTVDQRVQNDDSVVLQLDADGTSVLLTGDLERSIILPGPVDILKIPHHGSKNTKLSVQFRIPIVSVGASNPFGHPHSSKLPALRTDILGAIQIVLKPGNPVIRFPGL